jgi:hypothetical protein
MKTKTLFLAALLPATLLTPNLNAQIPPGIDASQVVSGRTYAGRYEYQMKDGSTQEGRVHTIADPKHGSAVIITVPDRGEQTTTLVSPGMSITH